MNSDDFSVFAIVFVVFLVFFTFVFAMHRFTANSEPKASDVTAEYAVDAVLPGHRVYKIEPIGHGPSIYVVAKDGEAVATRYREPGKHGRNVEVVTP